jgi:hypothetical protein
MLTDLDETLHHQAPLTFDHVHSTDHRFYDRQLMGAFHPEGKAGFLAGISIFKNMNVMEGFVIAQSHGSRQYNVRFSRQLRPFTANSSTNIGPLRLQVIEPYKLLKFSLESGDYPVALDFSFRSVLPPRMESPHTGRLDGRMHTDYLRYHQFGSSAGTVEINGEPFNMDSWFAWRDHSWGVRPGVGGFEPMTGTRVGGGVASASRTGGKGMFLLHMGFWNGQQGGGIQVIEDGDGKRIYTDGEVREVTAGQVGEEQEVERVEQQIDFHPGTRVFDRVKAELGLKNGGQWNLSARAVGSTWAYCGAGYDGGFNDGKGQGVWRSEELLTETDVYDVSHPEDVIFPDGSVRRPRHREQLTQCDINGVAGSAYVPMFVIGAHPRFGFTE